MIYNFVHGIIIVILTSSLALADSTTSHYLSPASTYPPSEVSLMEKDYNTYAYNQLPWDQATIDLAYANIPEEFTQIKNAKDRFAEIMRRNHAVATLVRNGYWVSAMKELAYLTHQNYLLEKDIKRIVLDSNKTSQIIERVYYSVVDSALENQTNLTTYQKNRVSYFYREVLKKMSTSEFKKEVSDLWAFSSRSDDNIIGLKIIFGSVGTWLTAMAISSQIGLPPSWFTVFFGEMIGSVILTLSIVKRTEAQKLWATEKVKRFQNVCRTVLSERGFTD